MMDKIGWWFAAKFELDVANKVISLRFHHARAAKMVGSGALELDRLVTRTIPLADLPSVLAAPPGQGEVKTIVLPARA